MAEQAGSFLTNNRTVMEMATKVELVVIFTTKGLDPMPDIQKVSVALTGEQVDFLRTVVDAGEYATTSEAVREALREWQWKRELRGEELLRLRQSWQAGKASGKAVAVDMARMRERARAKLKKAAGRTA